MGRLTLPAVDTTAFTGRVDERVLILGGGTGGTLVANRLRRVLPESAEITVIDGDDRHLYQPGLLFVPFGARHPERLARSRKKLLHDGVRFVQEEVASVDTDAAKVTLTEGSTLGYDVLVVASGARLVPEETEGLLGPGWMEKVFHFYSYDAAVALRSALDQFRGGRLVVNFVDLPIKCPVAPLEFLFLADAYFRKRKLRDKVTLTFVTPLDSAFTKATCAKYLSGMLDTRGIGLVTQFNTGEVDGAAGKLVSYDGREVRFDLGVVIPLHQGAAFVGRSPELGDPLDFVRTDPHSLQAKVVPNVFAIGDAADLPTSKAGSVAHFAGHVVAENIRRFLANEPLTSEFDGHTNCFIESGDEKALLIDFNYEVEPLPGRFPSRIGLPLLRESRLNHLGKLGFEAFYWHGLLRGRDVPGVGALMPFAGKKMPGSEDRGRSMTSLPDE